MIRLGSTVLPVLWLRWHIVVRVLGDRGRRSAGLTTGFGARPLRSFGFGHGHGFIALRRDSDRSKDEIARACLGLDVVDRVKKEI